jgi:hypothetical protein
MGFPYTFPIDFPYQWFRIQIFTEPYHCVKIWTGGEDMTIKRNWQRPETVPIWAEVKLGGVLTDPTGDVLLTLVHVDTSTRPPTETTILDEVVMTKDATGMYIYYWTSEEDSEVGWYRTKVQAQDGIGDDAIITIEYGGFILQ